MDTQTVFLELQKKLKAHGINLIINNKAVYTSSIYAVFSEPQLYSCTIRDHPGRPKYAYKWNLVKNYQGPVEKYRQGKRNFFYSFEQLDEMVNHIVRYYNKIKTK